MLEQVRELSRRLETTCGKQPGDAPSGDGETEAIVLALACLEEEVLQASASDPRPLDGSASPGATSEGRKSASPSEGAGAGEAGAGVREEEKKEWGTRNWESIEASLEGNWG